MPGPIRILLIGVPGGAFSRAAALAREAGAEAELAGSPEEALALLRQRGGDLAMIDVDCDVAAFMESLRAERFTLPVLACGIEASAARAVAAIRAGARDYVPLPPDRELIAAAIASVIVRREPAHIGTAPGFARALALAAAIAGSPVPVLITGETGSGKESLARRIQEASGSFDALVVAECEGVPADVLESELFGHEAGAFPGAAARRIGRLEKAARGTILLREVGALAPAIQARLSSAILERRFTRIGGSEPVSFNARLVATSSVELSERVGAGKFRADLLARLALLRIEVPPLRERGDDVLLLARHFVKRIAESDGVQPRPLSDDALALLRRYHWPANVRELEDTIHRAMLLAHGDAIEPADLLRSDGTPIEVRDTSEAGKAEVDSLVGRTVEEVERELILHTLERCNGNRTSASSILGISVRTMRNKLRSFIEAGIPVSPAA